MEYAMNLPIALLDLLVSLPQHCLIGSIRCDIVRCRSQGSKPVYFPLDILILGTTTNPDNMSLIGANHVFAPDLSNTTRATNHNIDPFAPVYTLPSLEILPWKELLTIPFLASSRPCVSLWIWGQSKDFSEWPSTTKGQIYQSQTPVGILFGQ